MRKDCAKNTNLSHLKNKNYPAVNNYPDMTFTFNYVDGRGESSAGYTVPQFFGEAQYGHPFLQPTLFVQDQATSVSPFPAPALANTNHTLYNICYTIDYSFSNSTTNASERFEIIAEGTYNARTGRICMVGCRYAISSFPFIQEEKDDYMDCEVLVDIQLASLNPEPGDLTKGSIRSTRDESDPRYLTPLDIYAHPIYSDQAQQSIWRIHMEIFMVVASLTLSCALIRSQLLHVKRHPNALPSVSITMLANLALGNMTHLFLNFNAISNASHSRQDLFFLSSWWMEVNEVVVVVMTMVVFLLLMEVLRVAWSARCADEGGKGLWIAEGKVLGLCILICSVGASIVGLLCSKSSYETKEQVQYYSYDQNPALLTDYKSYVGFILDGFLLPQIILNIASDSKDKPLAPFFYVGMTAIRSLPHLYDAYRSHCYLPYVETTYIYASSEWDFYSTAWNIIIPLEGMLLGLLVGLQQHFGGWILSLKSRKHGGYETTNNI